MVQKIVVINGNPETEKNNLNSFLSETVELLNTEGYKVISHTLSDKKIKSCIGCWDCWWKTPGLCRHKDDAEQIMRDIIRSDWLILSSPLIMGMYSALLKMMQDRMVLLVHPYIEMRNNESHHLKRYPKYPKLGAIIDKADATEEEIKNVRYILDRFAINFHSEVKFFKTTDELEPKDISYELSNI